MDWEKAAETISNFIKERCENRNAIVGMSGGIDSTVVSVLCCGALGKKRVHGVIMPHGASDEHSEYAMKLADELGIRYSVMNIEGMVNAFVHNGALGGMLQNKLVKGNLMARVRMCCLYTISNEWNGLVVGTTNKTELMIGYYTKYGDGGVDIEPIFDIYKTDLREFARYLGIDEEIITMPPTAGLWKGQTDEDELGLTYDKIDGILKANDYHSPTDKDNVIVNKLVSNSGHKRGMPFGCGLAKVRGE